MDTLRWLLTALLGAFSLFIIVGNPVAGLRIARRGRNYSFVPFIGGLAGCAALLCCPIQGTIYYFWIPLLLDVTFPAAVYVVVVKGILRR